MFRMVRTKQGPEGNHGNHNASNHGNNRPTNKGVEKRKQSPTSGRFYFQNYQKNNLSKERKITPFFYITLFPRIHRHAVMYETEVSRHAVIRE